MGLSVDLHTGDYMRAVVAADAAAEAAEAEGREWTWGAIEDLPAVASAHYPDHACNPHHLVSSYSASGFGSVARQITGRDLYWVFEECLGQYADDRLWLTPTRDALLASRDRAVDLAQAMQDAARGGGALRAHEVTRYEGAMDTPPPDSPEAAIATVRHYEAQLPRMHPAMARGNFDTALGSFFLSRPIGTVVAAVNGRDILGGPATYVVYRTGASDLATYVDAAHIVVEFIDAALGLPEPVIAWSS